MILIAHCGWVEERKRTLDRLVGQLQAQGVEPRVLVSETREHANVWARRCLESGLHPQERTLILNDDVEVHPNFVEYLCELGDLLPEDVLSFHSQFEGTAEAAKRGLRLVRSYWVSGPAFDLPAGMPLRILRWLATIPPQWFAGDVNEDGMIAQFLWRLQRPSYHVIPALVMHNVTVASTLGYDNHPGRRSPVDWDTFPVQKWTAADVEAAPYIEVPWESDVRFQRLGDALRGMIPLCGMCWFAPADIQHDKRHGGVCYECARKVSAHVLRKVAAGL